MRSRVKLQYCKVVIATSLVWALFDVFLLMYLSDCTDPNQQCNNLIGRGGVGKGGEDDGNGSNDLQNIKDERGFLQKILPKSLLPKYTPTGPGEMGKAVKVPENLQAEAKDKFKIHQFNLIASNMISLNRSLPDVRMDSCKRKEYPSVNALLTTSVIIVFHNEAWSTLLRTVWSVINRSPWKLLEEIILVDDASERDEVKQKLDDYVAKLPVPVHVLRSPKRAGLVRARLRGAAKATGGVLTFLDAHCECTEGWLEPLLNEIYKDRTSVVCPIIDVISDDTFEYITGSDMTYGGFNWKLNFRWYGVPQRELQRRNGDRSIPLRSPTMAGGLFAIDRDYFYEIGSYDEGMDIWGGENLEMSFRVWMCGGQVLIVTCSRVGHVFRKTSPYSWPGGVATIINHNTMRIIEVWMDEYKEFYNKINPRAKSVHYGDISSRKELRAKLKCKSFRWYLENIYPESQIPIDYHSLGEVRNKATGMCLDSMGRKNNEKVGMVSCHGMGGNQIFAYTSKSAIQADDLCIDVSQIGGPVIFFHCHGLGGNQNFDYVAEVLVFSDSSRLMMDDNKCVGTRGGSGYNLYMLACTAGGSLEWNFDHQTSELKHISSSQCLGAPKPPLTDVPSIGSCNGALDQKWELQGYHS